MQFFLLVSLISWTTNKTGLYAFQTALQGHVRIMLFEISTYFEGFYNLNLGHIMSVPVVLGSRNPGKIYSMAVPCAEFSHECLFLSISLLPAANSIAKKCCHVIKFKNWAL